MLINFLIFPIYLDYSSTTPLDPRIVEKLIPYFYYKYGNHNSKSHIYGWISNNVVKNSLKKISKFLNCESREIILTSCVSESNNYSIKGFCFFYKNMNKYIISIKTEHKSIINCLELLNNEGFNIVYLPIKSNGLLNYRSLFNYLKKDILLLTLSYVNNEIGVLQNIKHLSNFCQLNKIVFHIDACQALVKIYIDLKIIRIDMLSISSHKIYGPKGIAALYIRRKSNLYFNSNFYSINIKKNSEYSTLPTSLVLGFAESLNFQKNIYFFENLKIKNLKNIFFYEILKIDFIKLNGDFKYRIPHNLNLSFNDLLITDTKYICVSSSSACSLENKSHVLKLLKNNKNKNIRFSFGRYFNLGELYFILKIFFKKF